MINVQLKGDDSLVQVEQIVEAVANQNPRYLISTTRTLFFSRGERRNGVQIQASHQQAYRELLQTLREKLTSSNINESSLTQTYYGV